MMYLETFKYESLSKKLIHVIGFKTKKQMTKNKNTNKFMLNIFEIKYYWISLDYQLMSLLILFLVI